MIDDVLKYFAGKANGYDLVENQNYWRLSDALLWSTLKEEVLSVLDYDFNFLDAGGGTGRWSFKILDECKHGSGVLYDISNEMLEQAKKKIKTYDDRLRVVSGDLHYLDLEDDSFDLSFNFHNVLGFVDDPLKVLKEIERVTKKNGLVVSFVPNLYHNIFFNVANGKIEDAKHALETSKGRFIEDMPYIHLFTPEKIKELYNEVGLECSFIAGFPVTIYPGTEETKIEGETQYISDMLSKQENFNSIFYIEKSLLIRPETSSRGNNIFIVGRVVK